MYENQGIYSLPRIKGNLLGTFNFKRMGMDGAFHLKLITCFSKTSFTLNAGIRAAARF